MVQLCLVTSVQIVDTVSQEWVPEENLYCIVYKFIVKKQQLEAEI